MEFMEWNHLCETGIPIVDKQHKKLFNIINQLSNSFINSTKSSQSIIHELVDYTVYHFSTEEKLMKESHYHDHSSHEQEHLEFIRKVLDFQIQILNGEENLNKEILSFLKNWLINHILTVDKKFAEFYINIS